MPRKKPSASTILLTLFAIAIITFVTSLVIKSTQSNDWSQSALDETERRGTIIVQAIDRYHTEHNAWPNTLADLNLDPLPQPTVGTKEWEYSFSEHGFALTVSAVSVDLFGMYLFGVDTRYFIYASSRKKWQVGS